MSSINEKEVEHFESMANEWWNEDGTSKPLHKLNPTRIDYITNQIANHFNRDEKNKLDGLTLLDIGCGGGLVCEPLAAMGADVTGIDAGEIAINVAKNHAEQNGLKITYLNETSDTHDKQYDVVLALEILEHVDHVDTFIQSVLKCVKPNGLVIFSTLNRTAKSFAFGIVAAEYLLRWLPRGTHNWNKFMRPSELAKTIKNNGYTPQNITGLHYNPLIDHFSLSQHDIDVNYFLTATQSER